MLFFNFLSVACASFETLTKKDLVLDALKKTSNTGLQFEKPFLVFLYLKKDDFRCPMCEEYKNHMKNISIDVRELNFIDNVELGSRFLLHTFPAFLIRYMNRSYILNPESPEDLIEIVNTGKWKNLQPVRSLLDANSFIVITFSKINRYVFWFINLYYYLMKYIPNSVITGFTFLVIAYLVYSICDVLAINTDEKIKKE